ncbi:MAG: hypothetical protein LH616_17620 [Ilumatobacteraceae bacterium]|nr:hypothetical protein [Ilumatobacteraceae bacterium]
MNIQKQLRRRRATVDSSVLPAEETGGRLVSLDVARGMAVAMMLFVEQLRGNGFPSLRHVAWVVLACRRLSLGRSRSGGSGLWVGLVALVLLVAYGQWLLRSGLGCGSQVTPLCNAPGALDRSLLPVAHLYRGADFPGYDPEGVASSVAPVVTVLAGWVAMRGALARQASVRWWLVALPAAAALWAASWIGPLTAGIGSIKRLWSPAFTLRTAAIALVVLALCRPLDGLRHRAAAVAHRAVYPLSALGRHALTIYVGQHLIGTALDRTTMDGRPLADRMAGHFSAFGGEGRYLAFAIACTVVATAVALTLDALDRTARRRRQRDRGQLVGPSESWNLKSESTAGDGAHTGVNDLRRSRSVSSGGDFSQERVQ